MNLIRILSFTALVLATLSFAGCAKGKKGGGHGASDGDYVNGTPLPDRQEGVSFLSSNVDRNKFSPVHFGFDSYTVGPNEQGKIQEVAGFLRSSNGTIIVAGFTDERGTPEYNR